jgi:VanZ family protein
LCRLGQGWRAAGWALLAASLFGVTDEWHQAYVPGRAPDVFDWVADTWGAAVAVALYTGWPGYRQRLEMKLGRKKTGEPRIDANARE